MNKRFRPRAFLTDRCTVPTLVLYVNNMAHGEKEVRSALGEADTVGLKVVPTKAHGHSWGYIDCPKCPGRLYVWSSPRSPGNHARDIRRFIELHQHPEGK